MRFIDLTTKYHIAKEKVNMSISIVAIILVCIMASVGVHAALNNHANEELKRRQQQAEELYADITISTIDETSIDAIVETESTVLEPVIAGTEVIDETAIETTDETIEDTSETSSTTEATTEATTETTAESTTEVTTEATTTTESGPVVTEYYATVYASQNINLRSGPGVEYDIVRTLDAGDQIDVTGRTESGWYRTYSGNYVMSRYTQSEPPATTAAATLATTQATQAPTAQTTAAQTTSGSTGSGGQSGMTYYGTCTITFYGPQPLGDGTYSTSTATGTTCSEGRTVAADWGIFPAGTVIYIANDPLGGDGYYTVEDRGSGVNGSHIDIYANNGESYSTTSAEVYVVN